ncbi:MAG: hypothetical protein ORN54_12315 [Cyclobacteriaceae bacterium]|nr:hypothetical protein [Cyclobacteriaceae bacterium]
MLNVKYSILFKTLLVVGVASSFNAFSQIKIVQIDRQSPSKENKAARRASLPARALPFWDDFSSTKTTFPDTTTWEKNSAVWVNSGTGINPPSLNVATFDGYDAQGKPYSVNNVLANGLADQLTSRALKLGDVPPAERSGVFISFFYQFAGNGETPDPGDVFSLLFKNAAGQWKQVWSIESNTLSKPEEFIQVPPIPIVGGEYFHNDFQFRFQNFGRLSGPFDTWNLDYVYVNKGRTSIDKYYPDRTLTLPITSIFSKYTAIPIKHINAASLARPKFFVNNLKDTKQNINSSSSAEILSYKSGVIIRSLLLLDAAVDRNFVFPSTAREIEIERLIDFTSLDLTSDLLKINYKLYINTKDNLEIDGDYKPAIFAPIDFRKNDTTSCSFSISNYYAYDDGVAEYGANITGAGTQLAYQFDMSTTKEDTIVGVDLFFPKFGDETNQNIQLHILGALTGNQSDYLFQKIIPVERSNRNDKTIFKRIDIPGGVVVKNTFYLGWKLTSPAEIPIGLDANNDSGEKIFVNSSGSWIQNKTKTLKGSLMIRPIFGKPKDLTTNVTESASVKPFPNPTQQRFFLPSEAKEIQLYTVTGSSVSFEQTDGFDKKEITINNPLPGLYLVRYFNQIWHTEKIMVAP